MKTALTYDRDYIVVALDAEGKRILKSEIWHPTKPLSLGHPIAWILEKLPNGIRIRNISSETDELVKSSCEEFTFERLRKNPSISLSRMSLRIHAVPTFEELSEGSEKWNPKLIECEGLSGKSADEYLRKTTVGVIAVFTMIGFAALCFPQKKPNPEELLPPQFAKLLLSPAFKSNTTLNESQAQGGKAGKASNLAQTFQSEVVQKAAQKLLKGGAMSLLAKSDLLGTASSHASISNIFDANSKLDRSALKTGDLNPKAVQVGILGGKGDEGSKSGSGYAKGNQASLSGQGSSFLSLDTREVTVEEGLTADEIGKVIHSHLSEVRYCYESSMVRNASIEGKLTIDFTIRSSGGVKTAKVKGSTLTDPNLDKCILSHLVTWKFPKPKGGVEVGVSYPFIFKTLGK